MVWKTIIINSIIPVIKIPVFVVFLDEHFSDGQTWIEPFQCTDQFHLAFLKSPYVYGPTIMKNDIQNKCYTVK